jgi:putative SOS response-associated peptidase YedK
MCGRYSMTRPVDAMQALFDFDERPNLAPRWNIGPTQTAPVIRRGDDGRRHLAALRWGLVPGWMKDLSFGAKAHNARAESAAEKPMFREAFRKRRCLVPADGYYEWAEVGRKKQPYRFVAVDGSLLAFAGLWERWRPQAGEGEAIETFTIITTPPSAEVEPICDRMPAILAPEDWAAWLDPASSPDRLQAMLKTWPDGRLSAYPVTPKMNAVAFDDPSCGEPIAPEQPRLL